jgi:hypothetical protein
MIGQNSYRGKVDLQLIIREFTVQCTARFEGTLFDADTVGNS